MIIIIIVIILFIAACGLHILNCFTKNNKYFTYNENGDYQITGSNIDCWPSGKPKNYDPWKCYPCTKTKKIVWCGYDWDAGFAIFAWFMLCISGVALGVCGGICIHQNSSWGIKNETVAITEHITELENDQQALLKFYETGVAKDIDISSSGLPERIKEHNAEVKDLVKKVKSEKINLENPWISLFISPAYKNVDVARIEATYINLQ